MYLYILSIFFMLLVAYKKRINLISIYGIFTVFSLLYNLVPYFNALYGIEFFKLSSNLEIISQQCIYSGLGNFSFSIMYLFFYKNVPYEFNNNYQSQIKIFLIFLFFSILTVFYSLNYGWNQLFFAGEGGGNILFTIASYIKLFSISCYLYFIYRFGLNKYTILLLIFQAIIMVVDGARTQFLPILILTIFLSQYNGSLTKKNRIGLLFILFISFLMILLTRALIMSDDEQVIYNMILSFIIEACAGSYVTLQTLYGLSMVHNLPYTYGLTYLFDPFVWFLPQGPIRDSLLTFNGWFVNFDFMLDEKYSPMGGFFYIAESLSVLPVIGPIIVAALFAATSIFVENNKNKNRMIFLVYFATVGVLFSKAIFGNIFKLFIIELLFSIFLIFIFGKNSKTNNIYENMH